MRTLAIFLTLIAAVGCERPSVNRGGECSLNSDCDDPLVCALDRCRRQCLVSRDCGAGLMCLRVGAMGGACQLAEEVSCALTSDCNDPLVCRFGTCTTECVEDRDCTSGAACQADSEMRSACIEPSLELCIWDSDCPDPFVCSPTQQCSLECVEDRDCSSPRRCVESLCQLPDAGL